MISVLIPVYNEEAIVSASVLRLNAFLMEQGLEHEIIVTDNGSTDGTYEICNKLAVEHSWLRVLRLPERGVGRAFVLAATEARSELLLSVDVDLSVDITFIPQAVHLLKYADMVVGSKTMGDQHRTFVRVLASQVYIAFAQLLFDLTISDFSIGAKAYRRTAILPALKHLDPWTGYVFELALFLKKQRRKVLQIGVDCNDERKSRFNLLHEGVYRYAHLFNCWRKMRRPGSWITSA